MKYRILGAIVTIGMSYAAPAAAQMIQAKDPQSVAAAMQAAGYTAQLDKDATGDPMINSAQSGSKFRVFFYNCVENRNCATIQFGTAYKVAPAVSLEKINQWNSSQRFGRAYLDKEGDPAIEMDLDLDDGGVSPALFTDNLEFWTSVMNAFEKHIGYRQ